MQAWQVGFGIAAVGALLVGGLLIVEPLPGNHIDLVTGNATRAAVTGPTAAFYDAPNGTTLASFGFCSHEPAGDAFTFRGDVTRKYIGGRWILAPEGGGEIHRTLSDVPLHERLQIIDPSVHCGPPLGTYVVSPNMILVPAWPRVIVHAAAISMTLAGAALALRARWTALAPVLIPSSLLLIARDSVLLMFLATIGEVIALLVGTGMFVIVGRRRAALALVLAAAAAVATTWLTFQFIASGGGEI